MFVTIVQLLTYLVAMNGNPVVTDSTDQYVRYRMADSCYYEVYSYPTGDSAVVVQTVCAPICSSHARVYNKVSGAGREIPSPYPHAIFPYALLNRETGEIIWEDRTEEILDEEERPHPASPQGEE